ncbi:MAG: tetratricopeptide repeat protein [Candidatus Sericytochromatia bacterium]|nr:tetratricopeptide repeat protein [Candidatus Sericytochromatia bacterium]
MRHRALASLFALICLQPLSAAAQAYPDPALPWQDLAGQRAPQADAVRAAMDRLDIPAPLAGGPGRDALARRQVDLALTLLNRFLATAPLGDDGEASLLDLARGLLAKGDRPGAVETLRFFLRQWPGSRLQRPATLALAALHFGNGAYADAVPVLKQYRSQWPNDDVESATYALAWSYQALGQFAEAEGAFRAGLDREPQGPMAVQARLGLGDTYWRWGRLLAAAQIYAAVGRQTNDLDVADRGAYLAGEAHSRQQAWPLAIPHFQAVRPTGTWGRRAQIGLAYALLQAQRPGDATPILATWLTQHPQDPWQSAAQFFLGMSRLGTKELPKVAEAFRQSWTLDKRSPWAANALYGLAMTEFRQAQFADSANHSQTLLKDYPTAPVAGQTQALLGEALYQQGQFQAAIRHLAAPEAGGAGQRALGFAYFRAGEYQAAIQAWQPYQDAEVSFYRAQAALNAGQLDTAIQSFQGFLKTYPTSMRVQEGLFGYASALLRAGRHADAIGPLRELEHAARPEIARASRLLLADSQTALKRFDEARNSLQAVITADPTNAGDAAYKIGRTWLQQGQGDKAIAAWESYRQQHPTHRQVGDALFNEGEILLRAKAYPEALDRFAAVLSHPASGVELRAQALMHSADTALAMGETARAVSYYKQVQSSFPTRQIEAGRGLLKALAAGTDLDSAVSALKTYRSEHPEDLVALEVLDALGQKLVNGDRYDEAIALLSSHPHPSGATLFWLGRSQRGAGQVAAAETTFTRIAAANEGFEVAALDQLAQMAFAAGSFDLANKRWQQLLNRQPAPSPAMILQTRFNVALAQVKDGKLPEAETHLRDLATDAQVPMPQRLEAYRRLGVTLREQRRWADAGNAYEQMAKLAAHPSLAAAEAQYWVGYALSAAGNKPEAVKALSLVTPLSPPADPRWLVQALFKQGELQETLGKWRMAIEAYQKIAAMRTEANWRTDSQARIRWIQQHIPAKDLR